MMTQEQNHLRMLLLFKEAVASMREAQNEEPTSGRTIDLQDEVDELLRILSDYESPDALHV
jgi:hypothetical protein